MNYKRRKLCFIVMTTIYFLGLHLPEIRAQQPATPRFNKTGDFNCESPEPLISIVELGFKGDHIITKWVDDSVIDEIDGTMPIWSSLGINEPVCYTKGAIPIAFAKFESNEDLVGMYDIRIKKGGNVFATSSNISPSSLTQLEITDLTFSSTLSNNVSGEKEVLIWEIKSSDENNWAFSGRTIIQFYWIEANPLVPTFTAFLGAEFKPLYDLALEKVFSYVKSHNDIIAKITKGIADDPDTFYDPGERLTGSDAHPLNAYSKVCLCGDFAALLSGLLRSIGVDGPVVYIWGGFPKAFATYTIGSTGASFPTFRVAEKKKDLAPKNPHFSYHAVVSKGGLLYDPSYGKSYAKLNFIEKAPTFRGVQINQVISNEFVKAPSIKTGWACPH